MRRDGCCSRREVHSSTDDQTANVRRGRCGESELVDEEAVRDALIPLRQVDAQRAVGVGQSREVALTQRQRGRRGSTTHETGRASSDAQPARRLRMLLWHGLRCCSLSSTHFSFSAAASIDEAAAERSRTQMSADTADSVLTLLSAE